MIGKKIAEGNLSEKGQPTVISFSVLRKFLSCGMLLKIWCFFADGLKMQVGLKSIL
jgi:hypothetical protein